MSHAHRDLEHLKHITNSQQKAYAHYYSDEFRPNSAYVRSPHQKPPKPLDPNQRSVYKHDYLRSWNDQTRAWYHQRNHWPYLVDTRRTIDPDFEVTRRQKDSLCRSVDKNWYGSAPPAQIVLDERSSKLKADYSSASEKSFERRRRFESALQKSRDPASQDDRSQQSEARGRGNPNAIARSKSVNNLKTLAEDDHRQPGYAEIEMRRRRTSQSSRRHSVAGAVGEQYPTQLAEAKSVSK